MPETIASSRPFIPPLQTHRFRVAFAADAINGHGGGRVSDASGEAEAAPTTEPPNADLCQGAFSEVTGLEASMEVKAIKEGGANYGAHQRAGQVAFATVVLKRGITAARDVWKWWALFSGGAYAHRLNVTITLANLAGQPIMTWQLERAMPVKFKAADFNAKSTEIGIEELHFVHEGLTLTFETPAIEARPEK